MSVANDLKKTNMSRAELEELSRFAAEELAKLDAKDARLQKLKADYHIEDFEYKWKINWYIFYEQVCASVKSGVPVDASTLEKIKEKSSEAEPLDYSKIYRCPKCGELNSLYVGLYEDPHDINVHAVTCSDCNFSLADSPKSAEWIAWEHFHEWLIKNGYLEKGTRQPERHPRRWSL